MEKYYKKIGSKTDRVEPEVIKQIIDGLNVDEIMDKLGVSKHIVNSIVRRNSLMISRAQKISMKLKSKNYKTERNKAIIDLIISGEKYSVIGEKFGISKSRVADFARVNGISRWKTSRVSAKEKISKIKLDMNNGMGYEELMNKHNLRSDKAKTLRYHGLSSVSQTYRNTRNETIVEEYKNNVARKVVASQTKELDSPLRIKTLQSVYAISSLGGYKRYPNIGKKCMGGSQETKEVLGFILTRRNIDKLCFRKIASELNRLKFVTIGGLPFTDHNVRAKYNSQCKKI